MHTHTEPNCYNNPDTVTQVAALSLKLRNGAVVTQWGGATNVDACNSDPVVLRLHSNVIRLM